MGWRGWTLNTNSIQTEEDQSLMAAEIKQIERWVAKNKIIIILINRTFFWILTLHQKLKKSHILISRKWIQVKTHSEQTVCWLVCSSPAAGGVSGISTLVSWTNKTSCLESVHNVLASGASQDEVWTLSASFNHKFSQTIFNLTRKLSAWFKKFQVYKERWFTCVPF